MFSLLICCNTPIAHTPITFVPHCSAQPTTNTHVHMFICRSSAALVSVNKYLPRMLRHSSGSPFAWRSSEWTFRHAPQRCHCLSMTLWLIFLSTLSLLQPTAYESDPLVCLTRHTKKKLIRNFFSPTPLTHNLLPIPSVGRQIHRFYCISVCFIFFFRGKHFSICNTCTEGYAQLLIY